jgi:hypothetical protein
MSQSFGPWATAIHAGSTPQLSRLWQRRLTRLPSLNRSALPVTQSSVLVVIVAAPVPWPERHEDFRCRRGASCETAGAP